MDPLAIITVIGGIALLVALFGGGIKAKEIEIPSIPVSLRILSGLVGIVLIGMVIRLIYPNAIPLPAGTPAISPDITQEAEAVTQPTDQPAKPTAQPAASANQSQAQSPAQSVTGDVVFHEDFQDGIADDFRFYSDDWLVVEDGAENKVLEVKSLGETPTAWTQADFGPVTMADYSIEYRVKLIDYDFSKGTSSGSTSLMFRQAAPGSYGFALNPYEHQMEFSHVSEKGSWVPFEGEKGVHAYDFQKNTWYAIRIEAFGAQLKAFVDGNLVFSVEDPRLTEGGFAFLRAPETIVQFDDVRVMK